MAQDLRKRTKDFALRIIRLYSSLPSSTVAQVIGKQVLRSGTRKAALSQSSDDDLSGRLCIRAHYTEADRSRSDAEFISKIEVALQELEETIYWFELLVESNLVSEKKLANLLQEASELIAIFVTSVKKVKQKRNQQKRIQ